MQISEGVIAFGLWPWRHHFLELHNSSYHTQPHPIIVKYYNFERRHSSPHIE